MMALVTSGLNALILEVPVLLDVVKYGGATWLLWLAFKMAYGALQPADPVAPEKATCKARPLTMVEAMLFQWVNPKGRAMVLACAGACVELAPSVVLRAGKIFGLGMAVLIPATAVTIVLGPSGLP